MDLKFKSTKELNELYKNVVEELTLREKNKIYEKLLKDPIAMKYSYILWEDEDELGRFCIGFNYHNDKGYIDDYVPEDREDSYYALISYLDLGGECNSCTYDMYDKKEVDELESKLNKLGLKRMQPAWR